MFNFGVSQISRSVVRSLMKRSHSSSPSGSAKGNLNRLLMEMPVDASANASTKNERLQKHIKDAQKQRQKIKERGARYVPGTVSLQILSNGSPGSPACVYLFTDQNRYLFNCGEGTQRLANEHKTKIARLEHIFMTQTKWEHIGGLPGLSLTVQDAGVPELTLHGPPGLGGFFNAMKRFVVLRNLKVNAETTKEDDKFEDDVMTVQYVPLTKTSQHPDGLTSNDVQLASSEEEQEEDYYEDERERERKSPKLKRKDSQNEDNFFFEQYAESVTAYVCKLKPKPGILCLEKCVERGVPPGPLLGQLKNGHDVTLPNGKVVKASDVKGPDDPGPVFIFLDIPDEEYLTLLCENQEKFQAYQSQTQDENNAAMVVLHFAPERIVQLPRYQEFIDRFSPSTQHLFLNDRNSFSGYLAAHRIQWKLNQVDEKLFPLLGESPNQTRSDSVLPMSTFHLRPRKRMDCSSSVNLNPEEFRAEISSIEGFADDLQRLKRGMERNKKVEKDDNSNYPKLIFLGTGSCVPNKTRNVSSILVYTHPDSCILMDCGEGTYGQIVRFYGKERAQAVIQHLKGIFISHLHADHHIGLIGVLRARMTAGLERKEKLPPVKLFAPEQIQSYLSFYHYRIEPVKQSYSLIRNLILNHEEGEEKRNKYACCGLLDIQTCLVPHCRHAFAVSITVDNKERTKITYSGDCLPSKALVDLGMNTHVLIHEATMEDELEDEAKQKMHSTVSQAIQQGELMNAKFTILTHFSQRYAKLPRMDYDPEKRVGIAFDNMCVSPVDLEKIHLLYPTLKLLFSEDCEEMEQKAIKRMNKRLRLNDSQQGN